jgi:adenine-specific DNA methylase
MLDPACGDGRFLLEHSNSVGVEHDPDAAAVVHQRAPGSLIHQGDFFSWASETKERFECAAGNPPFIRYQRFAGEVRAAALQVCARHGAGFSSLCSSWAPFIVATSSLLKRGGRLAFVVPAEIGHAPYAIPLLEYLVKHFDAVQIVAIREKVFPDLSEDCWLLCAEGFGGHSDHFRLSILEEFRYSHRPPRESVRIGVGDWRAWRCRLRSFLLPLAVREFYVEAFEDGAFTALGEVANVGIGYVTGANDFFHLKPSEAESLGIPSRFLCPTEIGRASCRERVS